MVCSAVYHGTNVNTFCKKTSKRERERKKNQCTHVFTLETFFWKTFYFYTSIIFIADFIWNSCFCFFITNYRNLCNTHWVSAVLFINQEIIKRQKNYRHISDRMINASLASKQNNSDEIKTMRKYHRWNYSRQRKKNNNIQKCLKKLRESDSLSYSLRKNKKKNRTKSGK